MDPALILLADAAFLAHVEVAPAQQHIMVNMHYIMVIPSLP